MITPLLITGNPSQHWITDPTLTAEQKLAYFNEAVLAAEAYTEQRIIKLLESGEHVVQFEFESRVFKSAWKQKCRCGYYGVFNEHLIALIKGEK